MAESDRELIERLLAETSALSERLRSAEALAPLGAQATDSTGAVQVGVDAHGLPVHIGITSNWRRFLPATALGAAAQEAFRQAIQTRMQDWSARLDETGWASSGPAPTEVTAASRAAAGEFLASPTISLNELTNQVLSALQQPERYTAATATAAEGSAAGGAVVIRLSPSGLDSVEIDADWCAPLDGDAITSEVGTALGRARAAFRTGVGDEPGDANRAAALDDMLAQAMAMIRTGEAGGPDATR